MTQLNLPPYSARLRRHDGGHDIYDRLRRKYVALTPEEWVRQHFVEYLIEVLGYPEGLMANEVGLTFNGMRRRCDTVVMDRSGHPLVIVEYKAPEVTISQRTFEQIVRYNMVLGARCLIVSNGMAHYCCETDSNGDYRFLRGIPRYDELTES